MFYLKNPVKQCHLWSAHIFAKDSIDQTSIYYMHSYNIKMVNSTAKINRMHNFVHDL